MVNEGDLNKINGDIFYAGDTDALVNIGGKLFQNFSQLIFNQDKAGFTANTNLQFENLHFDSFKGATMGSANALYDAPIDVYIMPNPSGVPDANFITTIDEFTTINAGSWASGGAPTISGGTTLMLDTDGEFVQSTFNVLDKNNLIRFLVPSGAVGAHESQGLRTYAVGSIGSVGIQTNLYRQGIGVSTTYTLITTDTQIFSFNTTCGSLQSVADVQGIGPSPFKIKFENYAPYSVVESKIDWIKEQGLIGSNWTGSIVSPGSMLLINGSLTNVFPIARIEGSGTFQVSTDSGANWEQVSENTLHNLTTNGSISRVMFQVISGIEPMAVYNYAVRYNLY